MESTMCLQNFPSHILPFKCAGAVSGMLLLTSTIIKQLSQNDTKLLTNVS